MLKVIKSEDVKDKKSIGERHIYTQQIIKLFDQIKDDEVLTYETMTEAIGLDTKPGGAGYGYQYSARNIYEKAAGVVFEAINNIGLKRLSKSKVAESSTASLVQPMKSLLRRQKRRIETLNDEYEKLDAANRFKVDATRTIIAFIDHATNKKALNMIENRVEENKKMLGFKQTVELFEKR